MSDVHKEKLKKNVKNSLLLQKKDVLTSEIKVSVNKTDMPEVKNPGTAIMHHEIYDEASGVNDKVITGIYAVAPDDRIRGGYEGTDRIKTDMVRKAYTEKVKKQTSDNKTADNKIQSDIAAEKADSSLSIKPEIETHIQYKNADGRYSAGQHVKAEKQAIGMSAAAYRRNSIEKELKEQGIIKEAAYSGIFVMAAKDAHDNKVSIHDDSIITGEITNKDISDEDISVCGISTSYMEEYSGSDILYDNKKIYESRKAAGSSLYKNREYKYYVKNSKRTHKKKNTKNETRSSRGIKAKLKAAGRFTGGTYRGIKNTMRKGQFIGEDISGMIDDKEDGSISSVSAINQRQVLMKYGNIYKNTVQRAIMTVGNTAMKIIVKLAKYSFRLVSAFFSAIIGPFLAIPLSAMFLIVLLVNIPPLSWIMGGYSSDNMIYITYQDKLREFEMTVDAYDTDDRSVINYTLDADKARKDALLLFMAKKGLDYDFNNITEDDAMLYGDLLTAMISHTCNISMYTEEIEDGALLTTKEIDVAVRASDDINGNNYGAYREDSCNVHGVISQLNTSDGSYTHYIKEWYFIPCEVSQYSIIPVGTCLELSVSDSEGNINRYILQVAAKMEDENMDNEMLYLCGDRGNVLDGAAKDENIKTKAYGALSWFTYNASYSELNYPDESVCYTGILDKKRAFQITDTYRLRYRAAESLAEEFEMTEEEKAEVFKGFYNATNEELEEAGIRVPLKTIYIGNYDAATYAQLNFSEEEIRRYNEVSRLANENNDLFEKLISSLMGEMSVSETMNSIQIPEGEEYKDTMEFLADVLIGNGFYIPNNASQFAKFCDDNGYTIQLQNYTQMQEGDICFVSTDEGTYKDITDIYIKAKGGYIFCNGRTGKVEFSKTLDYAETHRIGYNGEVMYARLKD